eukprot:349632-Chlamydomonas_euryale.AAC.49
MDAQLGCDEPPSTVRRKRVRDKAAGSLIQELHKSWGGKVRIEGCFKSWGGKVRIEGCYKSVHLA